ncbi:MAG: hypothetical protein PHI97_00050 [Desulfobulbus sp.]|nr:hypothetical protein [Desulfobulbus sp.]
MWIRLMGHIVFPRPMPEEDSLWLLECKGRWKDLALQRIKNQFGPLTWNGPSSHDRAAQEERGRFDARPWGRWFTERWWNRMVVPLMID